MQTKKKSVKKAQKKEDTLMKVAGAIGTIAGKISNQKDNLVAVANNAIDSVKKVVENIGTKKQAVRKIAIKKAAKKAIKKIATPLIKKVKKSAGTKKAAPVKKVATKTAKSPVKKATKKA